MGDCKDGIVAGYYDVGVKAYVGKTMVDDFWKVGRIQTTDPKGYYGTRNGAEFYKEGKDVFYIADNSSQHYYWVDWNNEIIQNAIVVKPTDNALMYFYVGRTQVDGQMQVGPVYLPVGLVFPKSDGLEHSTANFQVLVCDPEPANPCGEIYSYFV